MRFTASPATSTNSSTAAPVVLRTTRRSPEKPTSAPGTAKLTEPEISPAIPSAVITMAPAPSTSSRPASPPPFSPRLPIKRLTPLIPIFTSCEVSAWSSSLSTTSSESSARSRSACSKLKLPTRVFPMIVTSFRATSARTKGPEGRSIPSPLLSSNDWDCDVVLMRNSPVITAPSSASGSSKLKSSEVSAKSNPTPSMTPANPSLRYRKLALLLVKVRKSSDPSPKATERFLASIPISSSV